MMRILKTHVLLGLLNSYLVDSKKNKISNYSNEAFFKKNKT